MLTRKLYAVRDVATGLWAPNKNWGSGSFDDAQIYIRKSPATTRANWCKNNGIDCEVVELEVTVK